MIFGQWSSLIAKSMEQRFEPVFFGVANASSCGLHERGRTGSKSLVRNWDSQGEPEIILQLLRLAMHKVKADSMSEVEKPIAIVGRKQKAGHRKWAARSGPVPGTHAGDVMSPAARSAVMSRIHGKNTRPERTVFLELRRRGVYFSKHAKDLPGRPDICFRRIKLAVFIDGDFWHGWRFPLWQHKLSPRWRDKIAATRKRDQRNVCRLRSLGWTVVRIWEHQVETDLNSCVARVVEARDRLLQECEP